MKIQAFINGAFLPLENAALNITDLALLRGYGIFDFFRVIDGNPIFLEDYLDRFENSIKGLHLNLKYKRETIKDFIFKAIQLHPCPLLGIKLIVTGGYSEDGYTPTEPNFIILPKPFLLHDFNKGLHLKTVNYLRELPEIKSINYLVPISTIPLLNAAGADDVLYFSNNLVTESSRSNFFLIKNKKLITSQRGILYGVTRKRVLAFAEKLMEVEVRDVPLEEVWEADEVFLTASTKRIAPITQIDDKRFEIGDLTKQLYSRLLDEEKS